MRTPKKGRPKGALHIVTYKRLEDYIRAFANGHLNLMILVGEAGIAKTRTVRSVLGDSACWIEGQATPFGMYEKLFRHRDELVVIDDVDSLYADRSGIRLLKCLCQTEDEKKVAWHSDAKSLERHRIPREFTTRSRVIIICNDWKTLNRNVAALQDRGHVLVFEPAASEVHTKAAEWFPDQEIYTWFGENLHRMTDPSFRHYVRARELKSAGMDWKDVLASHPQNKRSRMVAEILGNTSYQTMKQRAAAFVQMGGGCRATFFNHKRRLGWPPPDKRVDANQDA
jgi:hypothetical protein